MGTIKTMKLPGHDEPLSAEYSDDELAQMRALLAHAESLPRGSQERTDTLQDIFDIHYAKALFPGATLYDDPPSEPGESQDVAVPLFEFDPDSPFAPPQKVIDSLRQRAERKAREAKPVERDNQTPPAKESLVDPF